MNRVFRIIWSKSRCAWVVASELARPRGKGGRRVDQRAVTAEDGVDHEADGALPPAAWPLRASMLLALLTAQMPVWAADRYWDPNNTAVGLGGTGTWNTTGSFWSPSGDGVSGPYSAWNNAALDDAFFSTTPGTITLAQPITLHNLNFVNQNGWVLTGSTLTLGGVNPTITNAGTVTIDSVINSTSGLIKAGAGALTLNGSNSFGGGIDINGGGLTLNAANSFTGTINAIGGNLTIGTIGDAALGSLGNVINLGNGRVLTASGAISASRTINLVSGVGVIRGGGFGDEFYTGAGGMNVGDGIALTNDANDYQGQTQFTTLPGWSGSSNSFSSIADLGVPSALGAPTTVANGTILLGPGGGQALGRSSLHYTGDGDSSNRNWNFNPGNYAGGAFLHNSGSGTLTLTGNIAATGGSRSFGFSADSADMNVLGVISSNTGRAASFGAGSGHTIRLGTANTFSGTASIGGAGTVEASLISDAGVAGSLGTGSISISGGNLAYVGAGESTNKSLTFSNGALNSNGTGALTLGGTVAIGGTATLGGSFTGADNIVSGVISGAGNLRSAGSATWTLTGVNTYTGSTIVDSGVLRAATADAFGGSTTAQVNGGALDLNGFDRAFSTLSGTGGMVDLGSATLTLEAAAGTSASYAGNITGSGGLTKLGASTQTLTGANTYTGDTTLGGGTLNLDFSPAGGPASNIIRSSSTLNMSGGTLNVTGAAGEANTQTFNGLNITAGNNTIGATSGSGGSLTLNLGAITRTGGLMNFNLPGSGNITTTNTSLGGWATVNGTDYAKVEDGNILAFVEEDYTDKDNAADWADNEYITDVNGFFGAISGSVQLGGLRYTRPVSTTVTVNPGMTLGVDGTIIVAPSVLGTNQLITGGMITGAIGGDLGVQQNSTGNFTIASQIVDNGGSIGFTKAGTGLVTLTNASNSYTGATTVAQGTLSVGNIGDGGVASGIGASSADSSNLFLEGATLRYTGGTATSDRGFTIAKSGAILGSGIEVTNAGANLTFEGLVTSPDDAGFTKSGAGMLTLANGANDYVGTTTVTGGLLSVDTLADGGMVSGIGAASADAANLVLGVNAGLQYTGSTTTSTDRGFTMGTSPNVNSGSIIDVTDAGTTLTVSGTVDGAAGRLIKEGDGTLVLSGTTNYGRGNIVNAGVLRAGGENTLGAANVVPWNTTLADAAGVTLDLNNFDNMIGALVGGGASGGNVTLGSGTLRIAGDGGNYSGVISGTGGILRTNGGTQTFNGCNNTYTGATTLQGANLRTGCLLDGGLASGIGASSAAPTNLVFNSGSLEYTGGSVSIDRGFQLTGAGGIHVVNAGTTLEFEGAVIGGGTLIKRDAGTLVLSGTNTYTGNTQVEGGTLRAGTTNAFGPSGHMTLNNTAGVRLDLDGFNTTVTSLIGGGANGGNIALGSATLTILDGSNQTYSGAISGSGNLVKNGGGNQRLAGCNSSYSGTTTLNAGFLTVDCLANGGVNSSIGSSSADPANLVLNGGTLNYVGSGGSTNRQFTLGGSVSIASAGSGAIAFSYTGPVALTGTNAARTLTLTGNNTGTNTFAAQLDDNGTGATSLTKTGDGLWRLTSANSTYTGVTRINGGVLEVNEFADGGTASSIGASSNAATNLVIGNGSTLRYTGAGDSSDRRFTLDTGVTYIESSGTGALQFTHTGAVGLTGTNTARTIALGGTNTGNNTLGGTIGDNGTGATTLAKNDSGTWILTGNNTYSGNTVINNGNLMIGNGGISGNAGVGNVIVDSATSTLSLNRSDTFTFAGTLSGPGTLAQTGTGTSVLTSAGNQIGATTLGAGTLQVNGGLTTPTIAMSGSSTLTVNGTVGGNGIPATISGDNSSNVVNVNAGGTLSVVGNLGGGSNTVTLAGTLNTGAGALDLGAGDDTLTLNGGVVAGIVTGGAGTDTLQVNNAAAMTLQGGSFTGFERLNKTLGGTLTLTGNHSYGAGTTVADGTLLVNGNQTAATGLTSVASGATLGGIGTLAGAVTVASGGILAPGSGGAGTLTMGDLTLANGAVLNFELDQPGVAGGALNDLIRVNGNLVLDGTLNVSETLGGAFGAGVYRLIDYTGTLTDNGLDLGLMPAGSTQYVQTSIAHQVNLVNTTGLTLNYWDGDAGVPHDDDITGGNGTWRAAGDEKWTEASGSVNAPYANGAFAIFAGQGGTVTADNGAGAISVSGMQFAVDGYRIQGDAIALGAGANSLRVGDGSAAGSAMTATIDAELTGGGRLDKTDLGTLVLTGTNSYTGGTMISGGTLQLGDGGSSGSIIGDVVNNATLALNRADTMTFADAISGGGAVHQIGTGTTVLTGVNSYTGGTTISGGTLQIGDGGTSGGIAGDVLNNATLAFNRADQFTFAGAIAGNGVIDQRGAGTTLLTGNSGAFAGSTSVSGGALRVDGTLGNAASTATVRSGATLTGTGTLGGAVTVDSGGRLAPGNGPGQLTTGSLTLAGGALLDFELGARRVVGGALNDLVTVNGDLNLDGTLNIAEAPGGVFDIGVYRIIDYAGSLTDNTLDIGGVPAGIDPADLFVQTAVANQVNLINTGGLTFRFWDGPNGHDNGRFDGGAGTWLASSNSNWTAISPTANAPWTDAAFSVFQGAGGAVAVDDADGPVNFAGMQFLVGGYSIGGDTLHMSQPETLIRVGDGTVAGEAITATIDAAIAGSGRLIKADIGTLILGGDNTYSGGTTVSAGVLEIERDANLGAAGAELALDGGTLRTSGDFQTARAISVEAGGGAIDTQANTVNLTGALSGAGDWTKRGAGTLVLAGANTASGTATVARGTLQAGAANVLGAADYAVQTGALLDLNGFSQTIGALDNAGTVSLLGTTLTVTGGYVGNNGVLRLGTELGDDGSATDRLILDGGAASGRSLIELTNLGGLGAQTTGDGIELISAINGATTTAQSSRDAFALAGGFVEAGAFEYHLHAGDANGAGESWYLRSTLADDGTPTGVPGAITYRGEAPLYAAAPALLAQSDLTMVSTLHGREGDAVNGAATAAEGHGYRVWLRGISRNLDSRQLGTVSPRNDGRLHGNQVGVDLLQGPNHRLGLYAGQMDWDSEVKGFAGGIENRFVGRLSGHSNYLGAYWTYAANAGWYGDMVLQQGWHDGDAKAGSRGDVEGDSTLLSVEVGKPFALSAHWRLEPQAQVILNHQRLDAQSIPAARLSYDDALATTLRLGARLAGDYVLEHDRLQPYARLNLWHGVNGTDTMEVAGPGASTDIRSARGYTSLEAAVGATWTWNAHFALYGEAGRWIALDDSRNQEVKGSHSLSVGLRVNW